MSQNINEMSDNEKVKKFDQKHLLYSTIKGFFKYGPELFKYGSETIAWGCLIGTVSNPRLLIPCALAGALTVTTPPLIRSLIDANANDLIERFFTKEERALYEAIEKEPNSLKQREAKIKWTEEKMLQKNLLEQIDESKKTATKLGTREITSYKDILLESLHETSNQEHKKMYKEKQNPITRLGFHEKHRNPKVKSDGAQK